MPHCPPSILDAPDAARLDGLLARLAGLPGLVVAYSGGADSAFLLAAAGRALGPDRVLAATAESESLPAAEMAAATEFAAGLGVSHRALRTHEAEREGYRANAGERCYFCKAELLDVVSELAAGLGWPVATGTNADDLVAGFRPGIRAARERGALIPLADAGLTKDQIRAASRAWGLPTWDKPAAACLSSRIAYGIEITHSRLAQIERAERLVRDRLADLGRDARLVDLRVRNLGSGRARLELDRPTLEALGADGVGGLAGLVAGAGFADVDVAAFRSGSMNDALAPSDPEGSV